MPDAPVVDCNTCAHHKQASPIVPSRCVGCLKRSGYAGGLSPAEFLPLWEPKNVLPIIETIELTDVSPHAVVTDYEPTIGPLPKDLTCGCSAGRCNGASDTSGRCKATIPVAITGGQKHDNGKPPMDLLDRAALEETARVLAFGAKKYAAHNWRQGLPVSRTLAAALRHIYQFLDGETNDAETGLNHLGHAMCEVMFALNASKTRPDLDDRYRKDAK